MASCMESCGSGGATEWGTCLVPIGYGRRKTSSLGLRRRLTTSCCLRENHRAARPPAGPCILSHQLVHRTILRHERKKRIFTSDHDASPLLPYLPLLSAAPRPVLLPASSLSRALSSQAFSCVHPLYYPKSRKPDTSPNSSSPTSTPTNHLQSQKQIDRPAYLRIHPSHSPSSLSPYSLLSCSSCSSQLPLCLLISGRSSPQSRITIPNRYDVPVASLACTFSISKAETKEDTCPGPPLLSPISLPPSTVRCCAWWGGV